ncbi:cyclic nucleotide-gated ion channel 1-like [Pyrus x bretschneideri]|uniref:cyclic nucleotide-gated ion channel 1-like n=1 Tax=Pyrus x bretschneideri TaxID=225117 RepID=UPI002030934B|nr:cyclic nucleotide-gated ion channel 1-like [Pyrus x bretschneideri]
MMKISNEDPADGNIKLRRGYYSGDLLTTINSATTSTDAEDSDQTEEKKHEENIPRTNLIFVIACMVAISIDPLFLYIPIIDGESKCLRVDKKLRIVTLLFRSLIDITYIVYITYQIRQAIKSALPEDQSHPNEQTVTSSTWKSKFFDLFERRDKTFEFSWTSIIIDILAVGPTPQVLLGAVCFKMGGSRYLDNIKIVNFFLLVQYLPRFYEIYLAATEFRKNTPVWIKGAFNFFLYIIASHVLGAFWYLFSIERETACWHQAYRNTAGLILVWENLYSILIPAIGLLLFSYLIGNVQNCLLWEEEKKVQEPKRKIIVEGLRAWLSENNLRPDLEKQVVKNIKQAIELDKDAGVDNLFSLLPWSTRRELKRSLFKPMIKNAITQ